MADRPPRILIVEDEALVAWDYEVLLEDVGCHVVATTATGAGALKHVEALRPDVILLDVSLRGELDGIQTAHLLRKRGITAAIIFATALSDPETIARIQAVGHAAHLSNPVAPEELVQAVKRALKADKG